MSKHTEPAIWFPTVRTGTGTDVFTERLVDGLTKRGIRAEITWLPLRAEYAPWTVAIPEPPAWATVAHVNTWMHSRFLPGHLPIVATLHHAVHHPDARVYKGALRAAYHRFWIAPNERRVLRRAAHTIAVSQFVAVATKQWLLDVPIQVIHNGVDTDLYCPASPQLELGEPFRLLFVGSWMARKGVDLLAPIMRELGDRFELRYTGGGAAEKDWNDIPRNMHDIGRLQGDAAVIAAMRDADALLFPSRSEGHPLVAIEAMACGLPIIGTQGSSIDEAVTDAQTGILCPMDDVDAFVGAVRNLSERSSLREAMAKMCRKDAVRRFSSQSMVDAYCCLYEALNGAMVSHHKKEPVG